MDADGRRLIKEAIDGRVRERIRLEAMELDSTVGWEIAIREDSEPANREVVQGGFIGAWLDWLDASADTASLDGT